MNTPLIQKTKYNNNIAITSQNTNIQLHRSNKPFLNPRNKIQLTSSEVFKNNKPKQFLFQSSKHNVTSYSSSVKNTEESTTSINNKVPFTTKQPRIKTLVYTSQKQFNTELQLNKVNNIMNNNNKIKQVSIDLQRKYNKKKTSFPKKKKESCDICFHINTNTNNSTNEFGYVNQIQQHEDTTNALVNPSMKKHNSCNYYGNVVKRSLSKPMLNVHRVKDSHSNTKHKHKEDNVIKFQFKPRSNTYYIKSNNYIHSNNNNKTVNNTNSTTPQQSQVFSSISTVQTLFKANEVEPTKQVSSKDQITSIEELNTKLNTINPNTNNTNNNIQLNMNSNCISHTHHNTKCNIINAEMLDNSTNTNIINEDIYISSHNRIQTYKLLLDCISNKFSEIQSIVHDDDDTNTKVIYVNDNNNNNNNTNNKLSELHSKIEFTQDNILKQNSKPLKANPYDIDDDEMEEKTNMIIPEGGHSKTEPNDVYHRNNDDIINYNSFLQYKDNNQMMEPTISMNSELVKTFLELNYEGGGCNGGGNYYNNNNENIVSFLSNYQNEIKSFLQPSTTLNNKSSFINNNNHNNNNTSEMSDVIINNTNDTMTTIVQSGHNTFNKLESPHFKNNNNGIHIQTHCDKVNEDEDNKCLIY
jgi:hypothetical protein